jgi:hypothetical protein
MVRKCITKSKSKFVVIKLQQQSQSQGHSNRQLAWLMMIMMIYYTVCETIETGFIKDAMALDGY